MHLSPSSDELIGQTCVQLAADALPDGKGKFAIVSATPTSTNQNAWIAAMKAPLPSHPGLELVAVVYGDDVSDKSYRETVALLKRYPDLGVIVAPSSVGIVAAAKAVEDEGRTGKVYVTGLGLPSELAGHVSAGSVQEFAIWNPIDLGYAAVQLAVAAAVAREPAPAAAYRSAAWARCSLAPTARPHGQAFRLRPSNIAQFASIF